MKKKRSYPVTQAEFDRTMIAIKQDFDEIKATMATKEDIKQFATKEELRQMKEEIIYHFDAAVEKIEDDLKGANRDEISSIKDKQGNHEARITTLERQAV